MTAHQPAHAARRPAHLSRTRDPAPWSRRGAPNQPVAGATGDATATGDAPAAPAPVFVDDTGRRRRAGRLLAGGVALLTAGYLAVVGLTFAGAPLAGHLAPPGVERLARPAGDTGAAVGPGAHEATIPSPAGAPGEAATTPAAGGDGTAPDDGAPATAATADPTTSTTATTAPPPGQGTGTTLPTPSSTVPDRSGHGGGPPDEPPGKP
ncbi:MAG TPA: hypothetical protein VFZ77_16355 [Acidimicrobiales bacterium]